MLIDWFTVAAQAVNFLILMWLLKRFLYKPVLNAIDEREAYIVNTVQNAENEKKAADAEHDIFVKKNEDFERQRVQLLSQAREEAKVAGERLHEKERLAAEALREKWRGALVDEQRRFGEEIVQRVPEEVFAILRQALADLSDTALEARMIEVFDRRLRQAKDSRDGVLAETLRTAPASVLVKSAFDLSAAQQTTLRQIVGENVSADAEVKFETDANLIGGVELIVDGRKIAWAIADYLNKLHNNISDLLGDSSSSRTTGKPAAEMPSA